MCNLGFFEIMGALAGKSWANFTLVFLLTCSIFHSVNILTVKLDLSFSLHGNVKDHYHG